MHRRPTLLSLLLLVFLLPWFVVLPATLAQQSGPDSAQIQNNAEWSPVVEEFDGVEMVLVPSGCFLLDRPALTVPEYEVCIDEPFWLDRTEVSFEQLQPYLPQLLNLFYPGLQDLGSQQGLSAEQVQELFVSDLEANLMDSRSAAIPNLPPQNVNWEQAKAFCELRGSRLPTLIEWEYAARGPEKWLYPWGNEPDTSLWASFDLDNGRTVPVDSFPEGASWVGALNMMGNVAEYTSTLTGNYPYDPADGREDQSITGLRVVRGTSSRDVGGTLQTEAEILQNIGLQDINDRVGIRCARDAEDIQSAANDTTSSTSSGEGTGPTSDEFEPVVINAADQRPLTVYVPTGWSVESPDVRGNGTNTSSPEDGRFDYYAPIGTYEYGTSPELRYRVVPYTEYEDICAALSRLNTDVRQGARLSPSGSACDTFEGQPTVRVFGQNEWLVIQYDSAGFVSQGFPTEKLYTLAVTVGKGLLIEVALISLPDEHDELVETVLAPALTGFSFDVIEGEGSVGLPPTPVPYGPACTPNGLPTRLYVGGQGRPVSLLQKPIVSSPSDTSDEIGTLDGTFTVLEGPVCVEGTAYYRVDNNGLVGWIRETSSVPGSPSSYDVDRVETGASSQGTSLQATPVATATGTQQGSTSATPTVRATSTVLPTIPPPTAAPTPTQCEGNPVSRLTAGQPARVTPGDANNFRDMPSRNGRLLGQIPGGGRFEVVGGPTCAEGFTWVQVNYNGVVGWTVEAADEYWVEPLP